MQFMLRWKGHGPPIADYLTFSLKGAERPKEITVLPSTSIYVLCSYIHTNI